MFLLKEKDLEENPQSYKVNAYGSRYIHHSYKDSNSALTKFLRKFLLRYTRMENTCGLATRSESKKLTILRFNDYQYVSHGNIEKGKDHDNKNFYTSITSA